MAYRELPEPAPFPAWEAAQENFLQQDVAARKEFRSLSPPPRPAGESGKTAATRLGLAGPPALEGMQLHGGQRFVEAFHRPETPYPRLLVNWKTGTGKTLALIAVSQRYVERFRALQRPLEQRPSVFVLGFTARSIIQAEMLRRPELGFVAEEELAELRRLRELAREGGSGSGAARQLSGLVGTLRRRISDRARGGYYEFYGYKEFAARLLTPTRKGAAQGFAPQALLAGSSVAGAPPAAPFGERVAAAEREGLIDVNRELLERLRGGLLVADEVHNVYNSREKNNYGLAIQYALDFHAEEEAPRAVFLSATPLTGSAGEVVDLLNLLVPRSVIQAAVEGSGGLLRRAHLFRRADETAAEGEAEPGGQELRPGALELVERLASGRVSFLTDAGAAGYPVRRLVGKPLAFPSTNPRAQQLPYLQFVACPMSPYHHAVLRRALADPNSRKAAQERGNLAPGLHALYDIAFPAPPSARAGKRDVAAGQTDEKEAERSARLLKELGPDGDEENGDEDVEEVPERGGGDLGARLAAAREEWRRSAGVEIGERGAVGGPFLALPGAEPGPPPRGGLKRYSAKYARLVQDLLGIVRGGLGKILVYHNRVRGSGVKLLEAALQANGFVGPDDVAAATTLCAVCGRRRNDGGHAGHEYAPARYATVSSDLDRAAIDRTLARFNAPANLDGRDLRVLLGSRIVTEGLNFTAVRHQLVAALPSDIPTLLQVFGRAVRKGSHAALPPEQRVVEVRLYVSTAPAGEGREGPLSLPQGAGPPLEPELARYAAKLREYQRIQEIERALRRHAVDGFLAEGRLPSRPSLEALPYTPVQRRAALPEVGEAETASFEAYGHADREVGTIVAVLRALFRQRAVWTYDELWEATRQPYLVQGLAQNPTSFDEGNFALALQHLCRSDGEEPRIAALEAAGAAAASPPAAAEMYYVAVPRQSDGSPLVDYEAHLRAGPRSEELTIPVGEYVAEAQAERNFRIRFDRFLREYEGGAGALFGNHGAPFHYGLLRAWVEAHAPGAPGELGQRLRQRPAALEQALAIYRRYGVLLQAGDLAERAEARRLYEAAGRPARRFLQEAETPVGYLAERAAHFYVPASSKHSRAGAWRELPLGAVGLGSEPPENDIVVGYVEAGAGGRGGLRFKVRPPLRLAGRPGQDVRTFSRGATCSTRPREEQECLACRLGALRRSEARELAAPQICTAIRDRLLALEAAERRKKRGRRRWFYLFNERPPAAA
jgi:hypothetical protein